MGVLVSLFWFAKLRKLSFFVVTDFVAPLVPLGLAFGRLGNFINGELYGRITNHSFGMIFPNAGNSPRHPSQLYEAFFEGIILFFILNYLFKRKYIVTPGKLSALFLIFYSLFRYSLEFFRVPDPQIGFLFLNSTLGQIISLLFFVIGVLLFYLKKNEN